MEILDEVLPGCFLLQPKPMKDERGVFLKTYHEETYKQLGIELEIREEFYSLSHKNVIRGMHFQLPPYEHEKLIYCASGAALDVLVDLRQGPNYGRTVSMTLSAENCYIVFIPKGIAHGFAALTHRVLMLYKTSTVHAPNADSGIHWESFGFNWGIPNPIVSNRDRQHISLADFKSPF